MIRLLLGLLLLACVSGANAQPVQQSGVITPGHAACWAITGVIFDCGAPGGGVSVVGSTTTNDFVAFNASGSLIDSGINPANTSAISGLWNFNGGATAPTRPLGDSTTNVATTAFVQNYFLNTNPLIVGTSIYPAEYSISTVCCGLVAQYSATSALLVNTIGAQNAWIGAASQSAGSWIANFSAASSFPTLNALRVVSPSAATSAEFWCRQSDVINPAANCENVILYTVIDVAPTSNQSAWNMYSEMHVSAVNAYLTMGQESDVFSQRPSADALSTATPYTYNNAGHSTVIRAAAGNGYTAGAKNVSTGFEVVQNPFSDNLNVAFEVGYLCGIGSLDTSAGRVGQCLTMADNQSIAWYTGTGTGGLGTSSFMASIYEVQSSGNTHLHLAVGNNGEIDFDFNFISFMGMDSTIFFPVNTNSITLGGSSNRWSNIFSVLGNYSGLITASAGATVSGTLTLPDATTWTSGGLSALTAGAGTFSGQLRLTYGTPTIASGACGTGTNGSVAGSNQTGLVTVGASATASCTVSFSTTLANAPSACIVTQSAGTAELTKVTSISTSAFVIAGTTMASTSYYYICL